MSILKTRENDAWKSTYGEYFFDLLTKNKNLSDITDKAEARKNLELASKNVISHNHDSRYLGDKSPLANERNARQEADQLLDEDIVNYCNYLENMLSLEEKGQLTRKLSEIEEKLNQESENQTAADNNIEKYVNKKLSSLSTQTKAAKDKKVQVPSSTIRTTYETGTFSNGKEYIAPGVNGGIYTLSSLLDKLAELSHKHSISSSSETKNCRCDCSYGRGG